MSSSNQQQPTDEADELHENYYMILNINRDVSIEDTCCRSFFNSHRFLNISKATDKEITQAYHRSSLIYHPDKHQNSENRRDAELIFAKLKMAYEGAKNPSETKRLFSTCDYCHFFKY
jgi:preprotein translocase subunit Sec63